MNKINIEQMQQFSGSDWARVVAFPGAGAPIKLSWGDWAEAKYNRLRLAVLPKTATPMIIGGLASAILGALGLITALSGQQIPGLEFIASHIPASIVLSLMMMRAGLHTINNGLAQARKVARWRQEGMNALMLAVITEDVAQKTKAACYNMALPPEYRFDKKLAAGFLYGKMENDVHLEGNFHAYGNSFSDRLSAFYDRVTKPIADPWYNFWLGKQNAIGKLDVAVSQLMLVAAIASLVLLCMGSDHLPASLEVLAKDPHLSISFALLLFAYWLDCGKRGSRMQGFVNREGKRAGIEKSLQLIAIGKNSDAQRKAAIRAKHIPEDPRIGMKPHEESALSSLALPKLIVGTVIVLLGFFYFCQSLKDSHIANLSFLTDKVPLSIIFATTFITTGFFAFYQGATLRDKIHKKMVRRCTTQTANEIVGQIYYGARDAQLLAATNPPENLATRTVKCIAIPGFVLGVFLMLSGTIGLFAVEGYPIGDFLSFIKNDPQLSTFFFVTTILFGADAVSNGDRMRSYHDRKKYDHEFLSDLQKILARLQQDRL